MRRLTKEEIDIWNIRLESSGICLSDSTNNAISIFRRSSYNPRDSYNLSYLTKTNFYFAFSISEKAKSRFFILLGDYMSLGMDFIINHDGILRETIKYKISDFDFFKKNKDHLVNGQKYTQYIYTFIDIPILHIIYLVTCIEDTINSIQAHFEYDDNGETYKTKYKPGEIVSCIDDVSGDYIVQDIIFSPKSIKYYISKIEKRLNESIVFSSPIILTEEFVVPNRDNRIDILLN